MREIKLTFEWDGKTVHKEVNGFQGGGCLKQTDFINQALGTTIEEEMKPEYYLPNPEGLEQQNKVYS